MLLQTVRLIRFISTHIPTGKMQFELLGKHVQHEKRIAVFIFHLFGDFAIDSGDKGSIGKKHLDKGGEGLLQVFERKDFEESREGEVDGGRPFSSQASELEGRTENSCLFVRSMVQ